MSFSGRVRLLPNSFSQFKSTNVRTRVVPNEHLFGLWMVLEIKERKMYKLTYGSGHYTHGKCQARYISSVDCSEKILTISWQKFVFLVWYLEANDKIYGDTKENQLTSLNILLYKLTNLYSLFWVKILEKELAITKHSLFHFWIKMFRFKQFLCAFAGYNLSC